MTQRPRCRAFREDISAEIVNIRHAGCADARLTTVVSALVRHLHAFAKEVQLTQAEWEIGIDFLTRTGQICSPERQEFILLSDVLGMSMLVDAMNNRRPAGATENTVVGPFHLAGRRFARWATTSASTARASPVSSRAACSPPGAPDRRRAVDVWSDNAEGFYDVQQPDLQPKWNNRGIFVTGADGATVSSASSRSVTPFPTTDRWESCWPASGVIPSGPPTCTIS